MSAPRRLRPLLAALIACFALPATAGAAEPGVTPLGFTAGKAVNETPAIADALGKAPSGHRWVRLFADWSQTERTGDDVYDGGSLGGMDTRFRQLQATGARLIVTVQSRPSWAPEINTDAGARKYAEFMAYMADRYRGVVSAWELWNEPDDTIFWPGGPQPDAYARVLKYAYPAIKRADPDATVITGGLVGNDYDFVRALYAAGAGGSFDGVAVHTDTSCRIDAPDVTYLENGHIGRYAFTGYREVHAVMAANGDAAKGIWMTEIGWNDATDLPCTEGANAGKRALGVSAADQARFLKGAFACIAADPYVKMASWFTLQDHVSSSRFGLYDFDGAARPALAALKDVGDGTGAGVNANCGMTVDHEPPTVTLSAPSLYFTKLAITGQAADATTKVAKIELWVDGHKSIAQDGDRFAYVGLGTDKYGYGSHTIELRAYDANGNVGTAATTVTRGNPRTAARTVAAALGLKVKRKGRRFVVTATVRPPADGSFREQPHGRLELRFERRTGGRWKRSRVRKGIGDGGVHYTYTARKAGRWRVYAALVADAPYKATSTRAYTFKVR